MRIRFQADADLSQVIVSGLLRRFPEMAFRTATRAGLVGRQDPEERRASWLAWLGSYVDSVEEEVAQELPDPERGPEPSWRY